MVVIGCDHGGFELKEQIKVFIKDMGEAIEDVGTYSTDAVDYPDIALKVARYVLENGVLGILICGSGIGMSIAANKVNGIRCALCHDAYTAEFSRRHNNANIIAFGGRTTGVEIAKQMVKIFLSTEFDGGRHQRRIDKISSLEEL